MIPPTEGKGLEYRTDFYMRWNLKVKSAVSIVESIVHKFGQKLDELYIYVGYAILEESYLYLKEK